MSGVVPGFCRGWGAAAGGFGGGGGGNGGGSGEGLGTSTFGDLPPPKHILFLHLVKYIFYDRALTCTIHNSGEVIGWRRVDGWESFVEVREHGL